MIYQKILPTKVSLTVCATFLSLAGSSHSVESLLPGFRFVPSDYTELAGFVVDSDELLVHEEPGMKPNVVERKLTFSGRDDELFKLEIVVGSHPRTGQGFYDARKAFVGHLPPASKNLGEEGCADGNMFMLCRANVFVKGVNAKGAAVYAQTLAQEIDTQLEKITLVSPTDFNSARPGLKQLHSTKSDLGGNGALRSRLTLELEKPSEGSLTVMGVDKLSKHLTFHYVDESELWVHFVPSPPNDLPESGVKTTKAYINVINESLLASQISSDDLHLDFLTKRTIPVPQEVLTRGNQNRPHPDRLSNDEIQELIEERKRENLSNEEFSNLIRQREDNKKEARQNKVIIN